MKRFDAIVIGAGPAGSTIAYRLAREGASILLLDKARFPRDKPCGGGLTGRALKEIPIDPGPVVEHEVDTFEMRLRYGPSFERRSEKPAILMTQRRRLDHHLAEQAAAAGADFRDGVRVGAIDLREDGVVVEVGGERVEAANLVGADGANGVTAKAVGILVDADHGVALEGNAPHGVVDEERYRGRAVVELATVPGGYGWIFPKGDHVNFGVGGWESEGPRLREHLRVLAETHGVAFERLEHVRGQRLPMRRVRRAPVRGRALLVGDAAGLVDPLSGDGMYEAFTSSRLAAASILDLLAGRAASLAPYADALHATLGAGAAASWGAKVALDRYPRLVFGIARAPFVWGVVDGILRGELKHPGESRGVVRMPMKLLKRLARAAGDPGEALRADDPTSARG